MPGSGAISFTNYQMTAKTNPYLAITNPQNAISGNKSATNKSSRRKKDLEQVILRAKQI